MVDSLYYKELMMVNRETGCSFPQQEARAASLEGKRRACRGLLVKERWDPGGLTNRPLLFLIIHMDGILSCTSFECESTVE